MNRPAIALSFLLGLLLVAGLTLALRGSNSSSGGKLDVVAAENFYGNMVSQIGGSHVAVTSILSDPNADPHLFEPGTSNGLAVSKAKLVIQNGVDYDAFMQKLENASPDSKRIVVTMANVLGVSGADANPHLWYDPKTMPAVAKAMAAGLSDLVPAHKAYFQKNLAAFDRSLAPWLSAIAAFKAKYAHTAVATTEPVADYLLTAMRITNLTPFRFQADIMNGVEPSPQDISLVDSFFSQHKAKVFVYNQQVTDALTTSIRQAALRAGVPVVGVYETMPTSGYRYQSWMLAEVQAIQKAVTTKTSTQKL